MKSHPGKARSRREQVSKETWNCGDPGRVSKDVDFGVRKTLF